MILLGIFLIVSILLFIVSILLRTPYSPTVKAGDVNDFHYKCGISRQKPKYINDNGNIVDVSKLSMYKVRGESMKYHGIQDGQYVLTKTLSNEEKENLKENSVLMFSVPVDNTTLFSKIRSKLDSAFKLRYFICYVDVQSAEWGIIYRDNGIEKDLSFEEFESRINERLAELKDKGTESNKLILSETFDRKKQSVRYSLHGIQHLDGIVEYVF